MTDFTNFATERGILMETVKQPIWKVGGCKSCEDYNALSKGVKASLRALQQHSEELVFENQAQAIRLLMRARDLNRTEAYWHVHDIRVAGVIRYEKMREDLQPWLPEFDTSATRPAGARRTHKR
jgi:hypothetical protein